MPLLFGGNRRRRKGFGMYLLWRRMQNRRTMWVHPFNQQRPRKSEFINLYKDIRQYPDKFFRMYRMYPNQFDYLLDLLRENLEKKTTNYREPVSAECRLVITLT